MVNDSQESAAVIIENNATETYGFVCNVLSSVSTDNEIEDLETSLLKVTADASILEDSFNYTIELINRGNTQKIRKPVEDSFEFPVSQLIVPKTQKILQEKNEKGDLMHNVIGLFFPVDMSSINESIDIFDSPCATAKRNTIRVRFFKISFIYIYIYLVLVTE